MTMEGIKIHHTFHNGIAQVEVAHFVQPIEQDEGFPGFERLFQHGSDRQICTNAGKVIGDEIIETNIMTLQGVGISGKRKQNGKVIIQPHCGAFSACKAHRQIFDKGGFAGAGVAQYDHA